MLRLLSVIIPAVSALGVVGLIALFFLAPAIFALVMQALERVLGRLFSTRAGCVVLALAAAVPCTYAIAAGDQAAVDRAAAAEARAAFNLKLAGAARVASTRDQARAAAAEAARATAEKHAHELEAQIPVSNACFAPADTERLRGLWQPAARKARAPAAAAAIAKLLHGGRTAAEVRANH